MNYDEIQKGESELTFAEWEAKEIAEGRINKETDEILIVPNDCDLEFENDKLVIRGYSNLKVLHANNFKLKEVEIDCPTLEGIYLIGNRLENFDFTNFSNLKHLVISDNCLKELEFINIFCENLETLWCDSNFLGELDCSGMKKLEDLSCSCNYPYEDGEFSLKLDGCDNLKYLDADLNNLKDLNFTDKLPKLEEISLKQNGNHEPTEKIFFNSPFLKRIDISDSNIKSWENLSKTKEEVIENDKIDEGYSSNGEYREDAPTEWEQRAYERQQEKLRKNFEEGKYCWEGQVCLDLSGCDFIKSITIDGNVNYPKSLISINLGDNYLEEVIIRNMPNLARLIISHNNIKNLTIENCPQLDKNGLIYSYKSGDATRTPPPEAHEYNEQRDNPFTREEREKKWEKERMKKFIKDVLFLIADIEKDDNNGKWEKVKDKITNLKEWILLYPDWTDEEVNEKINKLEKRLLTSQTIQEQSKIRKIVIGFAFIIFLTLGILALLINKMVKKIRRGF